MTGEVLDGEGILRYFYFLLGECEWRIREKIYNWGIFFKERGDCSAGLEGLSPVSRVVCRYVVKFRGLETFSKTAIS